MITIKKSPNADSRSAPDLKSLDVKTLESDTNRHIGDIKNGLKFFADMLKEAGEKHDHLKLDRLEEFHEALTSEKIKESKWYKDHITEERHHLVAKVGTISGVPKDVNLIDVIEHLVDCVMAGMARSGEIYDVELPADVLKKAHENTIELLKKNITVG